MPQITPETPSTVSSEAAQPWVSPEDTQPAATSSLEAFVLDAVREELFAIPSRDLLNVNVDISAAALLVMGTAPGIRAYRSQLVALVGEDMTSIVDRLELVARAAIEAQHSLQSLTRGGDLKSLSTEAVHVREVLVAETRSLIARRMIAADALDRLAGAHGYQNQIDDLLLLTSILLAEWGVVGPRVGIDLPYLHRAEAVANALAAAVGARQQATRSLTAETRRRAYTLMARTYDKARRLISFLRWDEDDADRIAPPIVHGGRGGRRRKAAATPMVVTHPSTVE